MYYVLQFCGYCGTPFLASPLLENTHNGVNQHVMESEEDDGMAEKEDYRSKLLDFESFHLVTFMEFTDVQYFLTSYSTTHHFKCHYRSSKAKATTNKKMKKANKMILKWKVRCHATFSWEAGKKDGGSKRCNCTWKVC